MLNRASFVIGLLVISLQAGCATTDDWMPNLRLQALGHLDCEGQARRAVWDRKPYPPDFKPGEVMREEFLSCLTTRGSLPLVVTLHDAPQGSIVSDLQAPPDGINVRRKSDPTDAWIEISIVSGETGWIDSTRFEFLEIAWTY